ncbi:MAG: hypothetical protein K2P31_01855 [Rickettsiaceae bacterium]|nr:hypothetical protein [Rickettsiaceae bacterium]
MHIYSFLAREKESGHLILDDTFWIRYFGDRLISMHTSEYSKKIQDQLFPQVNQKILVINDYFTNMNYYHRINEIIRCIRVDIPYRSNILIQGFEEIPIIFFLLRARLKRNKVFLVLTNNISEARVSGNRFFLQKLLKLIFILSTRVIYHTNYELKLIDQFITVARTNKFFLKKYHLLERKSITDCHEVYTDIISFFGPIKKDKPILPFLDLIEKDVEKRFTYKIYNPGSEIQNEILKILKKRSNVIIVDKFISYHDYELAIQESLFIFLSHNKRFSGKLSGNFCDCISMSKPFISDDISPANEFQERYGQIGFIYNFEKEKNWANTFLVSYNNSVYQEFKKNFFKVQEDFTARKIFDTLDMILSI